MSKNQSKMPVMLSIVLVAGALLSACGENGGQKTGEGGQTPAAEETPKTIKVVANNGSRKYPEGMDANNNPYIQYVRDQAKVDVQLITPPADAYLEKLSVMMASGDLPDLMYTNDANWLVNYVNQKALQPLDDVLDKYGTDLKKLIPQEAWDHVTIDGKIYAVPVLNQIPANEIMYVRKDWLNKLGLAEPKTLEEYVQVMKAFVEQDPDGNGKNDTVGLVAMENLQRMGPFLGAFGVQRNQWYEKDGQLVNSSIQPEMREALEFLAGLYNDKLLDQEWALNKQKNLEEKVASGKAGLFSAAWYDTRGPIQTNKQNDPQAEWVPLEYPVGKDGQSGSVGLSIVKGYNVVPATSKNADAAIKMLNFIIGEGQRTLGLGFENEIWAMKDGAFTMDFEEHNKHIYRLTLGELVLPEGFLKEKNDALGMQFRLNENIDRILENPIKTQFLGTPTPAMGKYGVKLEKMESEVFNKIVMGVAPITDFDKFVDDWKKQGGDEIAKEVNDWYKNSKN